MGGVKYLMTGTAPLPHDSVKRAAQLWPHLRIRNSSITELAYTPKRHMLVTYNTLPHLDDARYADWVSYS